METDMDSYNCFFCRIGSTPPGAQRPFGLARVGPDTVEVGDIFIPWNHFGGYYYDGKFLFIIDKAIHSVFFCYIKIVEISE
jgi:hypothetical protein